MFFNVNGELRPGWWVALFLVLLAVLLVPLISLAAAQEQQVPVWQQAAAVLVASLICQLLRNKPAREILGGLNGGTVWYFAVGGALGALLMAVPALALFVSGNVTWMASSSIPAAWPAEAILTLAAAAATEELMFRGFVFRRLVDGMGEWPAQILIGAFFVLVHLDALQGSGALGYVAGLNIFVASILFGLVCLRSGGLAMPFALHFFANFVQGRVLGFGVSGDVEPGLLAPTLLGPDWLTGGAFGLEASVPGLACVVALTLACFFWKGVAR